MKLTRSQILVSILFFIFIVAIGAYYIFTYKNDSSYTTLTNNDNQKKIKNTVKKYTKEDFADDSTGVDDDLKEEINRELAKLNVNDATTQNKIFTYITSLSTLLNKYSNIEIEIPPALAMKEVSDTEVNILTEKEEISDIKKL